MTTLVCVPAVHTAISHQKKLLRRGDYDPHRITINVEDIVKPHNAKKAEKMRKELKVIKAHCDARKRFYNTLKVPEEKRKKTKTCELVLELQQSKIDEEQFWRKKQGKESDREDEMLVALPEQKDKPICPCTAWDAAFNMWCGHSFWPNEDLMQNQEFKDRKEEYDLLLAANYKKYEAGDDLKIINQEIDEINHEYEQIGNLMADWGEFLYCEDTYDHALKVDYLGLKKNSNLKHFNPVRMEVRRGARPKVVKIWHVNPWWYSAPVY